MSVGLQPKGKNTWGVAVYYWYHPGYSAVLFPSTADNARFLSLPPFFYTTMELLSKPLQAAADLDTARCKGQWQMIPELARRYKKYHPDESGIYGCARTMKIFIKLVFSSSDGYNSMS